MSDDVLTVVLPSERLERIEGVAESHGMSTAEWVTKTLQLEVETCWGGSDCWACRLSLSQFSPAVKIREALKEARP
jgi:hypothetical protein